MTVISAVQNLGQEDCHKFKAILGYETLYQKAKNKQATKKNLLCSHRYAHNRGSSSQWLLDQGQTIVKTQVCLFVFFFSFIMIGFIYRE